jgi:hypothetical protein
LHQVNDQQEERMDTKFKTLTASLAVVSALAVGGIANAAGNGNAPASTPTIPVTATVPAADPALPGDVADAGGATDVASAGDIVDTQADVAGAGDKADAGAIDSDNVQQGDQTSPDTAAETAGSEQPGNDGLTGHADEGSGTPAATTPGAPAN